MARQDFAQKRRSSHSASRQPRKHPAPAPKKPKAPWGLGLVTLLAVIGLGYLLVSLVDLQSGSDSGSSSGSSTTRAPAAPASAPTTPAPVPATIPEPVMAQPATPLEPAIEVQPEAEPDPETVTRENRFDFYDILPKSEVQAPEVDVYRSTPRDAEPEYRYLLQAGSFRDSADAERMRAQLILNGFPNVHTSQVSGENGVWYRVRTGPFNDRPSMNSAQDQLVRLRISPMVIQLD
ncbi:SPOR domain-containing protein [Nitrincola sp. MINF-07-Sa-05]|uniref:SPOR domain-containing protein n=1 Tax=Nitrincola salilacus TaxID=3400273 RepID=UPI0039182B6D